MKTSTAVLATPKPQAEPLAQGSTGLHPMTETKLWRNPCWLSFRFNFLALHYNGPLYDWIEKTYGLTRPEYVVIFSLGLHHTGRAADISASSGFPKNTLSRAVRKLCRLKLVTKAVDPEDGRNQVLRLTAAGKTLFDKTLPSFVDLEQRMLRTLSQAEKDTLSRLLAKIVLDSVNWPSQIHTDDTQQSHP